MIFGKARLRSISLKNVVTIILPNPVTVYECNKFSVCNVWQGQLVVCILMSLLNKMFHEAM
jgi:hypothetical protein